MYRARTMSNLFCLGYKPFLDTMLVIYTETIQTSDILSYPVNIYIKERSEATFFKVFKADETFALHVLIKDVYWQFKARRIT